MQVTAEPSDNLARRLNPAKNAVRAIIPPNDNISQTVIQAVIQFRSNILSIYSYLAIPLQSKHLIKHKLNLGGSVTYRTILGTLTIYEFSSSAVCSAMLLPMFLLPVWPRHRIHAAFRSRVNCVSPLQNNNIHPTMYSSLLRTV